MTQDADDDGTCTLCDRPVGDRSFDGEDGRAFCSPGCRDVVAAYGDGSGDDGVPAGGSGSGESAAEDGIRAGGSGSGQAAGDEGVPAGGSAFGESSPGDDGTVRTYFRVEGASRSTDEDYLQRVVEDVDGVRDAEVSYVTGTVRVDHDPDTPPARIRSALNTLGFAADEREGGTGGSEDDDVRRAVEPFEDRRRSVEDMISTRYVVGVVFGTFMLIPYVAFLYPTYLAPYVGGAFADLYGSAFEDGGAGPMLPIFAIVAGVVVVFTGMRILRGGVASLKLRRVTTDLVVSVTVVAAYVYSLWAMALGRSEFYFDLTVVVAGGVMAAVFYEATVKRRALDRLTDLTVSGVETARQYFPDGSTESVPVADLEPEDRVIVTAGERVPVDGTVTEGEFTVDEAVVTGESLPVTKEPGDRVVGGSLVTGDAAAVEVGDRGSTIDRLTTALWRIQSADHGIQRGADRLAGLSLPIAVAGAVLAAGWTLATGAGPFGVALTLLFGLVVATPWALGLATPLSTATAIEEAIEKGVLVFDDSVFERLRGVDAVVLDKTGTLTAGEMSVVEADAPAELLRAAGALEARAAHPAAEAIVEAFGPGSGGGPDGDRREGDDADHLDGFDPDQDDPATRTDGGPVPGEGDGGAVDGEGPGAPVVADFTAHATGVGGTVDGERVLVGHPDLFADRGWGVDPGLAARASEAREAGHLPVLVGREGSAEGLVVVGDEPREAWAEAVAGIGEDAEVVVLTGDDPAAARRFADHPAVEAAFAGVPPEGKTAAIRRIGAGRRVAMVGDGTNDAPALAAADLGIAMGSGTALAAEAADVAIEGEDLGTVATAFALSRAAGRRVRTNVGLALAYNAIAVPLALAGLANPLFVMLAVAATALLLAANSFRPLVRE